jgi:4-hydroxy-tetrahydrodipicolinate synthase
MARLYELKNIVGVKDATGDLNRVTQQKNKMGPDFIMLSGNDENAYEFNLKGGVGCISVSANVAPKLCSDFQNFSNSKKNEDAKALFDKLLPLHDILFIESNPSPAKYSLSLMKMMSDEVRLPLVVLESTSRKKIDTVLKNLKLI